MDTPKPLTDPTVFPTEEVLLAILGTTTFHLLDTLFNTITAQPSGLTTEWRYYNDGKSWLCKAVFKTKTIFWLSVWPGYFKTTFYFTEKHLEALAELPLAEEYKTKLATAAPIGRLIPLTLDVNNEPVLKDVLTLVSFKKQLK
ncbi:MAG TPA: hypothetical protein DD409_05815 [Bacteroidales bacterium]|nr:hypothetical protein [Bacteroidales bacterium]